MPEFDYMNHEFSFQTVFYNSAYSYCLCMCGFEHEYLEYILPSGEINETIYEKIVQCILDGECPHVQNVSPEYVKTTGILGLHVAAVVGTTDVLTDQRCKLFSRRGRLFGQDYGMTAILKGNLLTPSGPHLLLQAQKSNTDMSSVKFETSSILEFCVRNKNVQMLKNCTTLGRRDFGFENALHLTFKDNLINMQNVLLRDMAWFQNKIKGETKIACCKLAIVYDKPLVLEKLLNRLYSAMVTYDNRFAGKLLKICHVLSRKSCQDVLSKYCVDDLQHIRISEQVNELLDLLCAYCDMKDEIVHLLSAILDLPKILNSFTSDGKQTCLHTYIQRQIRKPDYLKTILDMGADVNTLDKTGQTPLMYLLNRSYSFRPSQLDTETLETLIYENPDLNLHQNAIFYAVKIDERIFTQFQPLIGLYCMDSRYHMRFKHEGSSRIALNFTAPIMAECGFRVPIDTIESIDQQKVQLHPSVYKYIQEYLTMPRSLSVCCRDSLRRHYNGRQIHAFVEKTAMPKSVKDFILLKPLLRYIH